MCVYIFNDWYTLYIKIIGDEIIPFLRLKKVLTWNKINSLSRHHKTITIQSNRPTHTMILIVCFIVGTIKSLVKQNYNNNV